MPQMQINRDGLQPVSSDMEQIAKHLPLDGARLLELGCGRALTTRQLAETFPTAMFIATEVDKIQHTKNLEITDLPNVTFKYGGAESIDLPAGTVDAVIMLKSLHHVPADSMASGLREIHRVLKPDGLAYISEPIYKGAFNDILRLFNDEKRVREVAFSALRQVVGSGLFELQEEIFFDVISRFQGFAEFEERILGATHSAFDIDDALYAQIGAMFRSHIGADGIAEFLNPHRVDLLRRRD